MNDEKKRRWHELLKANLARELSAPQRAELDGLEAELEAEDAADVRQLELEMRINFIRKVLQVAAKTRRADGSTADRDGRLIGYDPAIDDSHGLFAREFLSMFPPPLPGAVQAKYDEEPNRWGPRPIWVHMRPDGTAELHEAEVALGRQHAAQQARAAVKLVKELEAALEASELILQHWRR